MTIMLSRFYLITERYGQRDGQTDRQICYINIARRDKNQYASPTNQCNAGRSRAEAIITKSCVAEGFVTRRPKTFLKFS